MLYIVLYVCIRDCIYVRYQGIYCCCQCNQINQSHILNTSPRQVVVLTSYTAIVFNNILCQCIKLQLTTVTIVYIIYKQNNRKITHTKINLFCYSEIRD